MRFPFFKQHSAHKQGKCHAFTTPILQNNLTKLEKCIKEHPINSYNQYGLTPLQYSLVHQKPWCTLLLLEHKADPTLPHQSMVASYKTIQPAIYRNDLSTIRLLALYGADEVGVYLPIGCETARQCLLEAKATYQQIQQLHHSIEFNQQQASTVQTEQAILKAYQRLSELWGNMQAIETHAIYRAHYTNQQTLYQNLAKCSFEPKLSEFDEQQASTQRVNEATPLFR